MNPCLHAAAAFALALSILSDAGAAERPEPIMTLFERVPDLPATTQDAARWIDKRGKLVHPGLLALQADIQVHQQALGRIGAVAGERERAQAVAMREDLGQGLAEAGIDRARMQSDPAYAREVQERMRRMSPQELMAMSQRMAQPMNAERRAPNAAQAVAEDPPEVRAAALAGEAYSHAQTARANAHLAIWREAEDAAERIRHQPLGMTARKPAMAWENIGCQKACQAQWDAYASQALPLMMQRDTEILLARRAALQRHRAALRDGLEAADRHLVAARYGAASQSPVNQLKIAGYDGAAIGELKALLARITESVASAAAIVHCGKQAVLVPGAQCQ